MSETGARRPKPRRPKGQRAGRPPQRPPKEPPRLPGALPPKRPRTAADKRDTFRSTLLIGLAVHGLGIIGSLLALALALRSPQDELPIGNSDLAFPVPFILIMLALYVAFAVVHGVTLYFVRELRPRPALTVMAFGGFILSIGVLFAGFLLFGERFFLLGAAAAYSTPYFLAPLLVGVPTAVAAAVMSVRQVRSIARSGRKERPGSASPRLLR